MPPEWLEEIEWRVSRPVSWNGCWYITTRRRQKGLLRTDIEQREFETNPRITVMEYDETRGWINQRVRARLWIAQIFFEWDGIEDPAAGKVQGWVSPKGKRVVIEKPRSHWEVHMKCGDDRCINPAHMTFNAVGGQKK